MTKSGTFTNEVLTDVDIDMMFTWLQSEGYTHIATGETTQVTLLAEQLTQAGTIEGFCIADCGDISQLYVIGSTAE